MYNKLKRHQPNGKDCHEDTTPAYIAAPRAARPALLLPENRRSGCRDCFRQRRIRVRNRRDGTPDSEQYLSGRGFSRAGGREHGNLRPTGMGRRIPVVCICTPFPEPGFGWKYPLQPHMVPRAEQPYGSPHADPARPSRGSDFTRDDTGWGAYRGSTAAIERAADRFCRLPKANTDRGGTDQPVVEAVFRRSGERLVHGVRPARAAVSGNRLSDRGFRHGFSASRISNTPSFPRRPCSENTRRRAAGPFRSSSTTRKTCPRTRNCYTT